MTLRRKAAQLARAFDPDVVHSLHVYPFGAIVDSRRPVIVTVHGLEVEAIPPVVGSIQTARVVHANSTFTADLVRTRVPSPSPIEVHTWGIRQLPPAPARRSDFDLITVSRLVRRKNVDTVLRAIRAVGNLRYAVVGDGPELGALRDLSRSLGLTQVTFFGAVDEQRRHELLDSSRLFIMCPRHQEGDVEGLGLVFFEAFEHGLPVVASDKGGVPDAVGAAGLLVREPEDPDAVADAIRTALADDTCARLKASVLERQQSHSWDRFISGFEALYVRVHRGARG
jgi:glycosyltransferase involved in cell wall biosynthesis